METGKEIVKKGEQKLLPANRTIVSKTVIKPLKRASVQVTANTTEIRTKSTTTATVSKITKLVLKPKPTISKSSLATKVTTKQYIAKPVTIKSRSTMISHESTYRVQNIQKTLSKNRQSQENAVISVKNEHISRQFIVSRSDIEEANQIQDKPFEMVHSEHSANITFLTSPILQEITSAVVNGSNLVKNSVNDIDAKISKNIKENDIKKIKTRCENDIDCKPRSIKDPIKARQFIRMQKEKHKEIDMNETKAPATKQEIKERLNALRKNTLKIVEKNVQKARKCNVKSTSSKTFTSKANKQQPKRTPLSKQTDTKPTEATVSQSIYQTPQLRSLMKVKMSPALALTPSKFVPTIKSDKTRIGILRRPEGISPTLDSATFIAQTPIIGSANVERYSESNVNLNPSPEKSVHNLSEPKQYNLELKLPETIPFQSSLLHEITNQGLRNEIFNEFQNNDYHEGGEQCKNQHLEENVEKTKEIPFWLRPTPVQPYPYNFIVAVRKKLESITNPVFSPLKPYKWPNPMDHQMFHSPLSRPDTQFESRYRQNLDRRQSESEKSMTENIESSEVSPVKTVNQIESSPEQKEYSMNFSSVTESRQDQSDVLSKSKRKSVRGSQDTLSISSGILSHSSPEKKLRLRRRKSESIQNDEERPPSPLTTDNVDGLQITSRSSVSSNNGRISNVSSAVSHQSLRSTITSNINFGRGRDYSIGSIQSLSKLSDQQSVHEMLDDFKASLSVAIEANERLHDILSNPSSSLTQYSDDFEHATEHNESHISEQIGDTHETNTVPSYESPKTVSVPQSNGISTKNKISTEYENNSSTKINTLEFSNSIKEKSQSTKTKTVEDVLSYELSRSSSKQQNTTSNELEENVQEEESIDKEENIDEVISHTQKESSTLVEEKMDEYGSSESPTNNDLKSISLSIAKKSAPTSEDTDQATNAIESFSKQINGEPDVANESTDKNNLTVLNKTTGASKEDMNTSVWSEHNVSYATLGVCDQLLKSENRKSDDLSSLLKIREKALIVRFKGQMAWLELQKQKLKENGLTNEISIIKKKQRALLIRLNKDRKDLHRILKERQHSDSARNTGNLNYNISHMSANMSIRRTSSVNQFSATSSNQALKAIELPGGGTALERMLQNREDELRRRREHVEKLLRWHQRLDVEEQEVIKMEQMIMFVSTSDVYQTTSHEQINDTLEITVQRTNCQRSENSVHERSLIDVSDSITMERTRFEHKTQKQIHKIEQSLNTLKMISSCSISSDVDGSNVNDDVVKIYGRQLNKLWKRLTAQTKEKYTPNKVYALGKTDLELIYEQAKSEVLKQFHANEEEFKRRLIDNSVSIFEGSQINNLSTSRIAEVTNEIVLENKSEREEIVPTLDLNLVSSPEPKENVMSDTDQGYYFSNSNIDQNDEEEQTKTETQSVGATTLSEKSVDFDGIQIQTEEQIDEIEQNEQSKSLQEDVQSDISEDSLNESQEDISPSEIKTASQANESQVIGSGTSSQIPSVIETSPSTIPFKLNVSNSQMIEELSFPNIDMQTTGSSVVESDLSIVSQNSVSPVKTSTANASSHPSEDQKYQSDDFEDVKSGDELTSISIATVTRVTTTTTPTVNKSSENTLTPKTESQNELEKRLILIDNGMKELNETISHSPILQSEADSSGESEKSKDTKSSIGEDVDINTPEDESKPTETVESARSDDQSDEISEQTEENETVTESSSTENGASIAINETSKVDSDESTDSIAAEISATKVDQRTTSDSTLHKKPFQYTLSASSIDYNKVPEADALKRTQNSMEVESKSSEMFPFLREIPNKPPPPYPVHRQLPKSPPFPSDDRVKEIVYHRVHELYEKLNSIPSPETPVRTDATFVKSPSLSITSPDSPALQEETNVFERIIWDSCEEIMNDIVAQGEQSLGIFRQPLEFYNPPDRLKCYQQYVFKRIFKLNNRSTLEDSSKDDESNVYSGIRSVLPSQVAQLTFLNRRKRDAVDDILIQELYEDEARWTNFDAEEKEIRDNVTDLRTLLADDSSESHDISTNATNTE